MEKPHEKECPCAECKKRRKALGKLGSYGGRATLARHGTDHFKELAFKSAEKRRKMSKKK